MSMSQAYNNSLRAIPIWGSYYGTLMSLICLFSSVIDVLLVVREHGSLEQQRAQPDNLLDSLKVMNLHFTCT